MGLEMIVKESAVPEETGPLEALEPIFATAKTVEYGGRQGQEPTRYGDWEKNGRCIDF